MRADLLPRLRAVLLACLAPALVVAQARAADREPAKVSPEKIQRAVEKARDWLLSEQQANGSWQVPLRADDTRVGATALVMLALANAGVPQEHPQMQRGLDWIRRQKPEETYSVSLQTMLLAMLSPDADKVILERNVEWLESTQVAQGPASGSWSYGRAKGTGDNSNSQFALLALHEADRVGVRVRGEVWARAQQYWVACANPDGSWGYTLGNAGGSGSMTCAGIASVWITSQHVGAPDARAARDTVACCGGGSNPKVLERGIEWLGRRFSVVENPMAGQTWLHYYLYGLERVGRFTARRFIGDSDWYLEGAKMFVSTQDNLTGAFRGGRIEDPIVATSFALLFLAKGRRPVIVAKSRNAPEPDWNRHGNDIAHLVEHIEARWKKDYPAGLSWHVVDTPTATVEDLLQAPVLWISGKNAFNLGPDAGPRLRRYIDEGGFVFAEACCPSSAEFDRRLRELVDEIFPEPEYRLHLLPPEHPAWHAEEVVPPDLQRPLLGIDYGCRTCLIYAPPTDLEKNAGAMPSLSCLWEVGETQARSLPAAIRHEVDSALAIGTNVIAYATNRELKRKDELFALDVGPVDKPRDRVERGQLAIGKLRHSGMCDAAPAALANVLRAAARELGVRVDERTTLIDPADPALFDYHFVFMHGRQAFSFDPARREQIRQFLERGGSLLADSVCASPAFTAAFREEMAAILPGATLEEVPPDDPLFTKGEYGGYDIRTVTLREPAGGDGPITSRKRQVPPRLEGIRLGDRWAVIFSPYDLSCALEKQNSMECTGYGRDDAEKIALNILLYSLNH